MLRDFTDQIGAFCLLSYVATALGRFLRPDGFDCPPALAVLREGSVAVAAGHFAVRAVTERHARRASPSAVCTAPRAWQSVLLVPGLFAGDASLTLMVRALRRHGFRTYRSHIRANVGCTREAADQLEQRLEEVAERGGRRVQVVGHSLGGMLARGLAVRRPDLVAGIVTLGSPVLAPAAHHAVLAASVEALVRLSRAGVPGLMTPDCVGGECARMSFAECRMPLDPAVAFTAVYSRRDGLVDWRACIDPLARAVEVSTSHLGMAVDPRVTDHVRLALAQPGQRPKSIAA
jgi:pimeloyl-ACP methyl ester carboxylesterase